MEDSKKRRSAQQDHHVYQSVDEIFEDSTSTWIRNQGFRNYGYYTGSIASSGVETYAAPTAYGPSQNYGLYSSGMYSDPAQSGPSHVTSYNSMTRRVAPRSNKKSRCTRCSRKCCVIAALLSLGLTALLVMVLLLSQGVIGSSPAIISVAGQMRVTSWSYTESLSDPLSEAFLNYSDLFCREVELVARNTSNDAEFDTCNVVAFSPGSVMVDFELFFRRISSNQPNNITAQFGHNLVASIVSGSSFTTIAIDRSNILVEGTAYSDIITTETVSQLAITGDPETSRVETMMASRSQTTYTVHERIDQSTKPTDIDETTVVSRSPEIDETTVVSSNPDIDETTAMSSNPDIDETTVVSNNPEIDVTTVVSNNPEIDVTTVMSRSTDIDETTAVSSTTDMSQKTTMMDLTFNTRSDSTDAATTDLSTATTEQVYTDTSVTYYLTDEYDINTASHPTDTTTRHGSTDNVITDVTENDESSTPRPTGNFR